MFLDAVNTISKMNNDIVETDDLYEKWQHWAASKISHHGGTCCEIAREWLFAMDFSHLNGGSILSGPRWIRQRYNWGPTHWAIYWCEAVQQNALDCGAQAALANEVFSVRGVKSYPVQLVQQFTKEATNQWSLRWDGEDTAVQWIKDDLIYHEGCAIVADNNEIKIWDASAAWWINPKQFGGYGSLLAVRLFAAPNDPDSFQWGDNFIAANEWQKIKSL
jgi:hypothetical protein